MDPNTRYYGAAANYNKPPTPVVNRRIFVLIGIVLIVLTLIFVAISIFSSLSNAPRDQLATLIAREQSVQGFVTSNQTKITNKDLSKVNSEADILLTSDLVSLSNQLTLRYGLKTIPKEITAAEADTTSPATLTQATQSGKFNETYKEILTKKLANLLETAQALHSKAGGQLKTALQKNIDNLTALQTELASN